MSGTDLRQMHHGAWKLAEFNDRGRRERLAVYHSGEGRWEVVLEEQSDDGPLEWRTLGTVCTLESNGMVHEGGKRDSVSAPGEA